MTAGGKLVAQSVGRHFQKLHRGCLLQLRLKNRIEPFELDPRILGGKAPISRRIVPGEANVESGLSLLHSARIPSAIIRQYREASTVKKKSKLLDTLADATDGISRTPCGSSKRKCEELELLS
jgi:hypothetical protein